MGQKVNPHGMRVGVIKDWDSRWYAEDNFSDMLVEDYNIRKFLKKKLQSAGVSKIEVERTSERVKITVYTAKPGVVIGKGGAEIENTKKELSKLTDKKVVLEIKEIKRPDKDAQLVAENIAQQLENRVSFRRAMKSALGRIPARDVLAVLISHVQRHILTERFRCRHCARISIMVSLKQTQHTAKSASRYGSTREKFFRRSIQMLRMPLRIREVHSNVNAEES